jgi:cbb3-type cytochrome oxidase subunit 3
MDTNVGRRDRFARGVLAVVLALVAVWAFRTGRRGSAVAAALGALGFGFNAVTCFCGVNATLGIDTTDS